MNEKNWIKCPRKTESEVIRFHKVFSLKGEVKKAELSVSALGIYKAYLNNKSVTDSIFNPGYTVYNKRTQYQVFDVTSLLTEDDEQKIDIDVGNGWAVGYWGHQGGKHAYSENTALISELKITYSDETEETVFTSPSWQVWSTAVEYAELYHGETVNLLHHPILYGNAITDTEAQKNPLLPQEGEWILEHERLSPVSYIVTPKGERVIDFGQNITGYVEINIKGNAGDKITLSHAEVLDKDGNFYNANYREAKNIVSYILDGEYNTLKPSFSFQGFRYIRLDEYPFDKVDLNCFTAIACYSDFSRTGYFESGNDKVNKLFLNTIWGQKDNFLDVPTDCPQRDERLGWTGDVRAFCKTAMKNFNVKKFYTKWLNDMMADQREDGAIYGVCPKNIPSSAPYNTRISAGWGDASVIVPWELYMSYGDKELLKKHFPMMKKWVEYQRGAGEEEYLWLGGCHYGDWLAMDCDDNSHEGATSNDLIASAFYYYSTSLLVKAGEVLGLDMSEYKALANNIRRGFHEFFMENGIPKSVLPVSEVKERLDFFTDEKFHRGVTQTAIALILHFGIAYDNEKEALANKLVELFEKSDGLIQTGFIGTPYILFALTNIGRVDLAYNLLLEERNPSWLYSVNRGATTIWEHWDGIKEDGSFWDVEMNSFNHYSLGSVCDWMYEVVAGISILESGYGKILLKPTPNKKLGFVDCKIKTHLGDIESKWYYKDDFIFYEFTVPCGVKAVIILPNGFTKEVEGGKHTFEQR